MTDKTSFVIILFDGRCNLCNASVNFTIKNDRHRRFKLASLQSKAGKALQQRYNLPQNLFSVILIEKDGRLYDKSTAILRIARHLGFPWSVAALLMHIPRIQRDRIYAYIARNRYKWFGTRSAPRRPSRAEKKRFLSPLEESHGD